MSKFLMLIILTIFLGSISPADSQAFMNPYLMTHDKFVHLTEEDQEKFIILTMDYMVEIEDEINRYSRKEKNKSTKKNLDYLIKTYTFLKFQLQNFLISSAQAKPSKARQPSKPTPKATKDPKFEESEWKKYGDQFSEFLKKDSKSICYFAGWISTYAGGRCTHPSNLKNGSKFQKQIFENYMKTGNNCGPTQISCNPSIFGFKKVDATTKKGTLFCVSATKADSENASYDCKNLALKETGDSGTDPKNIRLKFIREQIKENPSYFDNVHLQFIRTCMCDEKDKKFGEELKSLNTAYLKKIKPHRTCYGLMEMAKSAIDCEEVNIDKKTEKFGELLNFEFSAKDRSEADGKQKGFPISKESKSYKYICLGENPTEPKTEEKKKKKYKCKILPENCTFNESTKKQECHCVLIEVGGTITIKLPGGIVIGVPGGDGEPKTKENWPPKPQEVPWSNGNSGESGGVKPNVKDHTVPDDVDPDIDYSECKKIPESLNYPSCSISIEPIVTSTARSDKTGETTVGTKSGSTEPKPEQKEIKANLKINNWKKELHTLSGKIKWEPSAKVISEATNDKLEEVISLKSTPEIKKISAKIAIKINGQSDREISCDATIPDSPAETKKELALKLSDGEVAAKNKKVIAKKEGNFQGWTLVWYREDKPDEEAKQNDGEDEEKGEEKGEEKAPNGEGKTSGFNILKQLFFIQSAIADEAPAPSAEAKPTTAKPAEGSEDSGDEAKEEGIFPRKEKDYKICAKLTKEGQKDVIGDKCITIPALSKETSKDEKADENKTPPNINPGMPPAPMLPPAPYMPLDIMQQGIPE